MFVAPTRLVITWGGIGRVALSLGAWALVVMLDDWLAEQPSAAAGPRRLLDPERVVEIEQQRPLYGSSRLQETDSEPKRETADP